METLSYLKDKGRFFIAFVRRSRQSLGDWFFNTFGYRDWEYQIYDYYGNFKCKRVWRLKIFKKVYTRDYDDDFS